MLPEGITGVSIISAVVFNNSKEPQKRKLGNIVNHNELILKLSGRSIVEFDGMVFDESAGFVRFLPASEKAVDYRTKSVEKGEYVDIFFDTQQEIACVPFSEKTTNFTKLSQLFLKAANLWKQKKAGYKEFTAACFYEILGILQKENAYLPLQKTRMIEPAVDYISTHFNENISIPYLADLCKISQTYLKLLFQKAYGLSPKAFLIQKRIEYARDLLATNLYDISSVAQATGYNDVYYFSNHFKKITGVSPSKYRKQRQ